MEDKKKYIKIVITESCFLCLLPRKGGGVNCHKVNIHLSVYNIILMSNNGHLAGQTECIIRISKEASTK